MSEIRLKCGVCFVYTYAIQATRGEFKYRYEELEATDRKLQSDFKDRNER